MEDEAAVVGARSARTSEKRSRKVRGVFEKIPGSGVWWIRYVDSAGRIRREKAGTKDSANALYRKRKTQVLEGRKLPEKLRRARVSFAEIAKDVLEHSKHTRYTKPTGLTAGTWRRCSRGFAGVWPKRSLRRRSSVNWLNWQKTGASLPR